MPVAISRLTKNYSDIFESQYMLANLLLRLILKFGKSAAAVSTRLLQRQREDYWPLLLYRCESEMDMGPICWTEPDPTQVFPNKHDPTQPNPGKHATARNSAKLSNSFVINIHVGSSVAEWLACWTQAEKARVQIAVATLSGNSLRQTVHTHRAVFTKQRNW